MHPLSHLLYKSCAAMASHPAANRAPHVTPELLVGDHLSRVIQYKEEEKYLRKDQLSLYFGRLLMRNILCFFCRYG